MSKRKRESFNEVVVGVFMTAVILLLAYFTIVISGVDVLGGKSHVPVRIVFDQVGGLKDHDNVMYRGTKVGKVESVSVTSSNLVVVASVDQNVILREGARISVCNLSMLGGNYLLLEEGEGPAVDLTQKVFKGETPTDWMRDVSKITENVRRLTEMQELRQIVTNVARVTEKADSFMTKAEEVAGGANEFMRKATAVADEIEGAVTEAKGFIERATTAAGTIDGAAKKADEILAQLNREKMFDDLEAGIAAFRQAAEGLDAKTLVAKAEALADNLNAVAERLKNGDGTLGKLVNDPTLYNEVRGMLKDARQVLDNYRDTTPISTFSSLATGAL